MSDPSVVFSSEVLVFRLRGLGSRGSRLTSSSLPGQEIGDLGPKDGVFTNPDGSVVRPVEVLCGTLVDHDPLSVRSRGGEEG